MRSILTTRHLLTAAAALLVLAALGAGCAKQDLYDPPGSPYQLVGRLSIPSAAENVAVMGDAAFVAGGEGGLFSVDLTDPATPQLAMMAGGLRYSDDIEVVRVLTGSGMMDVAYVLDNSEGILVYDITDPYAITTVSQNPVAWGAHGIVTAQGDDPSSPIAIYMADDWKGLYGWSIDPASPGELTSFGYGINTNGKTWAIAVRDGYGYVADNELGICVVDIDPYYSGFVSSWHDTPGTARDIVLDGDYAFVADGVEGLAIFHISGGDKPELVTQYNLNGFSEALVVRDGLCAIAANGAGVHFLDVSEPSSPIYLGSNASSYAVGVAFMDDGHCVVADEDDGLLVFGGRGPFSDQTPPAPVTDLVADATGVNTFDLTWTMTGDDRLQGSATGLDVRWSSDPIDDEESWNAATALPDTPAPDEPGTPMTLVAEGFDRNVMYHFATRVTDEYGQQSLLSNPASATTLDQIVLRHGRVTPAAGPPGTIFVFEVEVLWGLPLTDTEVIIDGVAHTMSPADGRFYRYETSDLTVGLHYHGFRFTGDTSPEARFPEAGDILGPAAGVAFTMGSPATELGRNDDETLHIVALSYDVISSPHEVTQAEWNDVMDLEAYPNPSQHGGADRPVDSVTWYAAAAYCNALSMADGLTAAYTIAGEVVSWNRDADGWRLPTEAEWEYLARAGTSTAFPSGDLVAEHCQLDANLDAIGWYCGNSPSSPQPVELKAANAFGLHDMSGNLREWCWDWYGALGEETALDPAGPTSGDLRVCRGGSWYYSSQDCRSAARGTFPPDSIDDTVGFRVVRTNFSR